MWMKIIQIFYLHHFSPYYFGYHVKAFSISHVDGPYLYKFYHAIIVNIQISIKSFVYNCPRRHLCSN